MSMPRAGRKEEDLKRAPKGGDPMKAIEKALQNLIKALNAQREIDRIKITITLVKSKHKQG